MTRALLASVATALTCLGAGVGAFLAGRSGGPNLVMVARAGSQAGQQSGARAGSSAGRLAGYRVGYGAGYHHAYPGAYHAAYKHAIGRK
jgi:hypothetical protein